MRILAITNLYPRPGHETLAPFNRQQFAAMAARDDLAVLAPVPWTEELRDWRNGRRTPRSYRSAKGIEVRHPRYYFTPGILRASYGRFFLASIQGEARRLIREFRPEVVLACWAHPDGWAAVEIAREAGLPVVIKVVGSDVLAVNNPSRLARTAEALRKAHAVVAVSQDLANHVAALGVDPDRVHVVYNGLDMQKFRPGDRAAARARLGLPPDGPIVLFVGNLLLTKGAGVLLEAMDILNREGKAPRCLVVGRGRDENRLREMISRLGLDGVVGLVGPKPHDQLADWYHACNLLALPSFSEGIPNVLMEASACGRPFVATHVGGIPEIARDAACRLIPPRDPQALAEAITEVLAWGPVEPTRSISWEESARHLVEVLGQTLARAQVPA